MRCSLAIELCRGRGCLHATTLIESDYVRLICRDVFYVHLSTSTALTVEDKIRTVWMISSLILVNLFTWYLNFCFYDRPAKVLSPTNNVPRCRFNGIHTFCVGSSRLDACWFDARVTYRQPASRLLLETSKIEFTEIAERSRKCERYINMLQNLVEPPP